MNCEYNYEERCQRFGYSIGEGGHDCSTCKERIEKTDEDFLERWVDPLVVVDRNKERTRSFHNLLAGRSAFLVCGGPSANDYPLESLNGRGVWSLAVNNMAAHRRFRPNAFVCSDPPKKFHSTIWLDPGIMKFVPTPKLNKGRGGIRRKKLDGTFEIIEGLKTWNCPNVWGFQRHSWMYPDDRFFTTEGACWGNLNSGAAKTGEAKTVCTTLLAFRILRHLGVRRIYLVGVDFRMAPDYGYAFDQARDEGASRSNNHHFDIVNDWLCRTVEAGSFKRFGMEVYNCYERSGLRAFPFVPFDKALADVKSGCEDDPDTASWYEK